MEAEGTPIAMHCYYKKDKYYARVEMVIHLQNLRAGLVRN